MTTTPDSATATGTATDATPARPEPATRRPPPSWWTTVGVVLTLVALACLAFLAYVGAVSHVQQFRAQQVAYADFRADLARSTAPTGQVGPDGDLLALGTPVALLTVAGLGLERQVVFEGTTASVLAAGPGHRRNTVLPGQPGVSVVYGRAWTHGAPFGGLGGLEVGERIEVTTGQGEHAYEVTGTRSGGDVVPPPPNAARGEGRLTLVSADGPLLAPTGARYVDARLVTPAVAVPARVLGPGALTPAEEAFGVDRTAWVPVTLLLLALAGTALAAAWSTSRWRPRQVWLAAFPVVALLAVVASRELVRLLPNVV